MKRIVCDTGPLVHLFEAHLLGILEVHGSLGVLLWGAATRLLDLSASEAALDRLRRSSLWVSPRVIAEARRALHDLFA
ncbi:MAG: DUF3368 domain-containing protein [bacterium]